MKIAKTIKVPIKAKKEVIDYLFKCNKESARVWNECVKINNEVYSKEKIFTDRKLLQSKIKGSFSDTLYAKCIQVTIRKFLQNLSDTTKSRKSGRDDVRYAYKNKKYYNTTWDKSVLNLDYEKGYLFIPRPSLKINGKKKLKKPLKFKIKSLPQNITQVTLIYDKGLKFAINYYEEESHIQINSNNVCGVDLGEIHAITSIDSNGNRLIITNRKVRSFHRFRNKELAKSDRSMSKCKKNSKNYKKYKKSRERLLSKSNKKISNAHHQIVKMFTNYVIENNIKTVVLGDLKHFNMNLKQRKDRKGALQKLSQWDHGKIVRKLKNKLSKYGVSVVEISESYTSQTCPKCSNRYKPEGRNYNCSNCDYNDHRDIVGAVNILSKHLNDGKIKDLDLPKKEIKYLRIA